MLTAKQEQFVQSIVLDNMTLSDAYRSAYNTDKMTDKTVNEKACILAGKDNIRARIAELRQEIMTPKVMSAQERLEWLSDFVKTGAKFNLSTDKIRAIDTMNKMTGEYVQKIEAEVQTETTINIELVDDDDES